MDLHPHEILHRFPVALGGPLETLGNHGGFSGARLWRVRASGGDFCLKAWPEDVAPARLAWVHALMQHAAGLPWIPRLMQAPEGAMLVEHQGRCWDLTTWMPGSADFSQAPSVTRLRAVGVALAQLHRKWSAFSRPPEICPAILRRKHSWSAWQSLVESGWQPGFAKLEPNADLAERLWHLLRKQEDRFSILLAPWLERAVALQPCVCDLWHDHVLFTGEVVTGIVDFGSAKNDHVAVDLARLLGSLIGDDAAMWEAGLDAYASIRILTPDERTLARDLDRTGIIIAATHWLRWLYHDGRRYDRPDAVRARLAHLVARIETVQL